jgi:hypothetical protein
VYYVRFRYSQELADLCCSVHCVLALPTQAEGNKEKKKIQNISSNFCTIYILSSPWNLLQH